MPIDWDPEARQLHLRNEWTSYLIRVLDNGALGHLHFGPALAAGRSYAHLGPEAFHGFSNRLDEPVALEYPVAGIGDFRVPALTVENADGSTVLDLRYTGHRIMAGTWARERHVVDRRLAPGRQSVGSLRGASGYQHNPFGDDLMSTGLLLGAERHEAALRGDFWARLFVLEAV